MPLDSQVEPMTFVSRSFKDYLNDEVERLLPEYATIAQLLAQSDGLLVTKVYDVVDYTSKQLKHKLPLVGLSFGCQQLRAPAITFVGGIHGIERIGSQVILSYLHTLVERAKWDSNFKHLLTQVRFNFLPVINPGGMAKGTRANDNGVDLMRNSPVDAKEKVPWLVGGQEFSRRLPWYRGKNGLERENLFLVNFLKTECLPRPFNLVIDCHSGFGLNDRIWIPYAYRRRPPKKVASYFALYQLWQQTYPHNNYIFEPQSKHYITHGDLWDHIAKVVKYEFQKPFLSLTLEMGSWNWVKKRPRQLFSYKGLFNPDVEHRWNRVQRRHLVLFDFLTQATISYLNWLPNKKNKKSLRHSAVNHWYR
ncbi:peptidase M14 [Thalassotalea insulae]|uniref:Peptidase M14 n=1 Tax=Thalassotalea insulae TaxID=2056778 RepID=A0ABQ6GZV0_9GAMM|nr:M14 family zinc carboxypeptidase [Thalassotalea insulae]GLX80300.1 peptidase M14 [Thalassotalea insulae]